MSTNPQSHQDPWSRERCPHCNHLLWLETRRCWACGRTPEEWATETADEEVDVDNPKPSSEALDTETTEHHSRPTCYGQREAGTVEAKCRECPVLEDCSELRATMEPGENEPWDDETRELLRDATVSLSHDGEAFTDPISLEEFRRRAEAVEEHLGCQTGEIFRQQTLDPTIFPAAERRDVPMVNLSLTGKIPLTQSEWESYCDQGLEAGRMVKMTLTGYLPDPHAKWVKRTRTREDGEKETWWEQEGAVKVKVLELGSFELRGVYDGE